MSKKIEVSREAANAIDNVKKLGESYCDMLVLGIAKRQLPEQLQEIAQPLLSYKVHEVYDMLSDGYELERLPEEKLLHWYNAERVEYEDALARRDFEVEHRAFHTMNGIRATLNVLGIKVKGINDKEE